jgi:hypothetical protein
VSDGSNAPRQGLGSFFRNLVDFIAERGLVNEVLARVSPETRSIWEKPPRPLSWLASFEGPATPRAAFLVLQGSLQLKTSSAGPFLPPTPRAP